MWAVAALIEDAKVQCAGILIPAIQGGCAASLDGIDFDVTGTEARKADIDRAWIFIIAVGIHFTTVGDGVMYTDSFYAPINGTGVSLHTIQVDRAFLAGALHAHRAGRTHRVRSTTAWIGGSIFAFRRTRQIGTDGLVAIAGATTQGDYLYRNGYFPLFRIHRIPI